LCTVFLQFFQQGVEKNTFFRMVVYSLYIYICQEAGNTCCAFITGKGGRRRQQRVRQEEKTMAHHSVLLFKPYPMAVGQKIHIDGGLRHGDWEVIGVSDRKVRLRCPVSHREFEWDRFCYFVEKQEEREWPQR
jgi:hypothetical protein